MTLTCYIKRNSTSNMPVELSTANMNERIRLLLAGLLAIIPLSSPLDVLPSLTPVLVSSSSNSVTINIPSPDSDGRNFTLKGPTLGGHSTLCPTGPSGLCLVWHGNSDQKTTLEVTEPTPEGSRMIHAVSNAPIAICLNISGQHLYGGPLKNVYPQEGTNLVNQPYITADMTRFKMIQPVTERYWYTSSGQNLKVDPDVHLFINQDKDSLCLSAQNAFPYQPELPIKISFRTCPNSKNIKEAVECFYKKYENPIPPEQVIGSPIWSTWVEYKTAITQEKAIQFFNDIKSHGMRLGVIEIDDDWETCYGSQEFNSKFPDPKAMVDQFHKEGYLTTLWVHPFVGPGCDYLLSLDKYAPYLMKLPNGSIGMTEWWNGKGAALVDFTNPAAIQWYQQRLDKIKEDYGFDSFKFDAGEAAYIPGLGIEEKQVTLDQPNKYTTNYVKMASHFGTLAEVRVGSEANEYKLMQRLQDTNSVWDAQNWGLRSVIPSTLQLSLHGYGAVLPDMVGGNVYNDQRPSKELFIRWVQLNTFLPVMQFSLGPWKYDAETVEITKQYLDLHYQNKDRIVTAFKDTSNPVINPIWWISPEDTTAQTISDQFLLGTSLLVAPVVEEGAVSRDIYLPVGEWKDANSGEKHMGPKWLKNYSVPLSVLPYFERSDLIFKNPKYENEGFLPINYIPD